MTPRFKWRSARIDSDQPFAPGRYDPATELNEFVVAGWEVVSVVKLEHTWPDLLVLMRRPEATE